MLCRECPVPAQSIQEGTPLFIGKLQLNIGLGRIVGMDVSHRQAVVTVLHPNLDLHQFEFPLTDEGLRLFTADLKPDDVVVMECSGNVWYLYQKIKPLVCEVAVADPRKLALITHSKRKCDRNDSYNLTVLKAAGMLPTVWMPDPETQGDREILHRRQAVLENQTRSQNQIRSLLATHGMTVPTSDVNTHDARLFLAGAFKQLPTTAQVCLASLLRELEFARRELSVLDAHILERAERWKAEIELLFTVPGIATFLGFAIMACVGSVDRFPAAASLGNYTGAVPTLYQSGAKSWSGGITKEGPKLLRWALTEAVYGLIRSPGYFYNFYRRIKKSKKSRHGIAIMACVRELAEVLWKMLTTRQTFQQCVPTSTPPDVESKRLLRKRQREKRKQSDARTAIANQPPAREAIMRNLDSVRCLSQVRDNPLPIPSELRNKMAS